MHAQRCLAASKALRTGPEARGMAAGSKADIYACIVKDGLCSCSAEPQKQPYLSSFSKMPMEPGPLRQGQFTSLLINMFTDH